MGKIYRQAVMAVIINEESKVLIGYSPRDKSYKFPQGGLEDEEDLITGIKRELKEELNYHLLHDHILEVYEEKVSFQFVLHHDKETGFCNFFDKNIFNFFTISDSKLTFFS